MFFFHGAFDWEWLQRVKYILMERMPREKLCAFILSKHLKEFLNVKEMFSFKRNRILFLLEKCFVSNTVSLLLWRVLLYSLISLSKKWFTIELADRQQRTNFKQLIGLNEIDKNRAIDFTIETDFFFTFYWMCRFPFGWYLRSGSTLYFNKNGMRL